MVIAREPGQVDELTEKQAREMLKSLLTTIVDASREDFFGTEGWEHFFGFDD